MTKKITFFLILSLILGTSVSAAFKPDDSFYNNQWYLSKIQADKAWDKINSSPDIVIAVIDSGVDIDHPDLKNNIWQNNKEIVGNNYDDDNNGFIDDVNGWDFVNNNSDPRPKFTENWTESGISHGTVVSGIIAAEGNNQIGISGISWKTQIMPLKAISDKGEGKISDIIRAIDYAVNNGAHIINLSFMNLNYSKSMQAAIERANLAGVMVVAAAGNDQNGLGYNTLENPIYPACYDGSLIGQNMVIGVAATDALDQKSDFSSYGNRCIDISAPGISIFSTIPLNSNKKNPNLLYDGYFSGTSMAAPQVSATLALIAQANPELNPQEIVSILLASVDDINNLNPEYKNQLGNGRLNINKAVTLAKSKLYSRFGSLIIIPDDNSLLNNEYLAEIRTAKGEKIRTLDNNIFKEINYIHSSDIDDDLDEEIMVADSSGFLRIYSNKGEEKYSFKPYDNKEFIFATADILGDNNLEIIVSTKSNGDGKLKVFNHQGKFLKEIPAYDKNYKGEIVISAGNIDGEKKDEIVISFGQGVATSLRIINDKGKLIGAFYPYGKDYQGGVELKVGNLNGRKDNNKDEIVIVPKAGKQAQVKIFDNYGQVINSFNAYNKNWLGGVNLELGDINNDGVKEVILGAKKGATPHVRIFSLSGKIMESFYAYDINFTGGVNILGIKI